VSSAKLIAGYSTQEDVFKYSTADSEIVLANIGDYGTEDANETLVANLVKSWNVDAIFTNGDNSQAGTNYDADVQADYGDFVDRKKMWPCPGNHDWDDGTAQAYLNYFAEIIEGRYYYQKTFGPVTLFMLDGNSQTPDGNDPDSYQADWLTTEVERCRSPWKVACIHQPPFTSSAVHGSREDSQWDFTGLDIVFSGHTHLYERLYTDGIYYVVNGLGGQTIYNFSTALSISQFRYNSLRGAGKMIVTPTRLVWRFYSYDGAMIDSLTLEK
jgi:predicted phosphodiesterase